MPSPSSRGQQRSARPPVTFPSTLHRNHVYKLWKNRDILQKKKLKKQKIHMEKKMTLAALVFHDLLCATASRERRGARAHNPKLLGESPTWNRVLSSLARGTSRGGHFTGWPHRRVAPGHSPLSLARSSGRGLCFCKQGGGRERELRSLPVPKRAEAVCRLSPQGKVRGLGSFRKKASSWKKFCPIRKVVLKGEEGALGPSRIETKEVSRFISCCVEDVTLALT